MYSYTWDYRNDQGSLLLMNIHKNTLSLKKKTSFPYNFMILELNQKIENDIVASRVMWELKNIECEIELNIILDFCGIYPTFANIHFQNYETSFEHDIDVYSVHNEMYHKSYSWIAIYQNHDNCRGQSYHYFPSRENTEV